MLKNALKVLPFIRPYRWELTFALVSGLLVAAGTAVLPTLVQLLIQALEQKDILSVNHYMSEVLFRFFPEDQLRPVFADHFLIIKSIAFCFPIYFLFFGWLKFYNAFQLRFIAERIVNEDRYTIMDRMLNLNAAFFSQSKTGSGGLLSRTLNDTLVVQHGMYQYIDLVREPMVAIALITVMFLKSWKLALFCIVFAPLSSIVVRKITKTIRSLSTMSQETLDLVTKNLKESIDGMRVIQSYNLETYSRQKFRATIDQYNHLRRKFIKRSELASPTNEFFFSFLVAIIIIFVGKMILQGEEDVGQFIAFITAAAQLGQPIKKIQQALIVAQSTDASLERVFEIIDSTDVVQEPPTGQAYAFPADWKSIEFKNVSFGYGNEIVLKNVSLTVRRGEIIALVGESGSGKSTLVNLLERFFDPTAGEILVDGININRFSLRELRAQIGLVTQDVFLFNETLEENIRAGLSDEGGKIKEAAEKANAMKFIDRLPSKFQSSAGERGSNFSGGEKQRLSIARAIFKNAPILILDEATSALDSASEVEVQKGLQSLMSGKTAFIIAHRLSTIAGADRILVMKAGEIVEQGTHNELLKKNGLYSYYQQLQDSGATDPV